MNIIWIKDFFKQTNMRKSYKKQILDYNVKKFSLIIKVALNMFFFAEILTQANQNAKLQVNLVNNIKKIIEDLKQHFGKDEH